MMSSLCLGIDIGTTSVKLGLLDSFTQKVVLITSKEHNASINCPDDYRCLKIEQSAIDILKTLHYLLSSLDSLLSARVSRIAICGQMHGVVLWNRNLNENFQLFSETLPTLSNLITWEDKRCTQEFLDFLFQTNNSYTKVHKGE